MKDNRESAEIKEQDEANHSLVDDRPNNFEARFFCHHVPTVSGPVARFKNLVAGWALEMRDTNIDQYQ